MSQTYSACKVKTVIAGIAISGFGESDMITVERDEAKFIKTTGADGVVSRSHVCHNAGQIQITLQQTSKANDALSGLLAADEATLQGQFPIVIKDLNGTSVYVGSDCWITGPPPGSFGKEIGERVWVIDCADLKMFTGGNHSGGFVNSAINEVLGAVGITG
jgi:hypothetical protein